MPAGSGARFSRLSRFFSFCFGGGRWHARAGCKAEDMSKLEPVFAKENGTATAGNASGITRPTGQTGSR